MSIRFETVPPAAAARAILEALFDEAHTHAPAREHTLADADGLAPFQQAAVARAEDIIARYGGVLIADPVGMGKTRVGAALARAAARTGKRTLVIAPATLRRQWAAALRHGRSTDHEAATITLTSHTDLSRDAAPDDDPPFGRIVVDEAHGFRNPDARRYRALALLARTADVVLLTATPVNNSLLDLYFLIRLFAGNSTFAALGAPDLRQLFHLAALAPDAPPAPALAAVIRAITVRRTRAEVGEAHLPATTRFPRRASPHTIRYTAGTDYQAWFDLALHTIEALTLAPYCLEGYGLQGGNGGAATLLRLLLAKRLESGMAAFCRSANDLQIRTGEFLKALERGFLRTPAQSATREDHGEQLLLDELVFQPLPRCIDRARLAADTCADLALLQDLAETGASIEDPKVAALEQRLLAELAGQKVLVFTEFRDTATDLWRRLRRRGGVALIHGSAAWLGTGNASRIDVIRRFAPRANNAPPPPTHEAVHILIATDVLSEGLNLQDAAHVVSYDLPWNPVRLLQRIGRIDRLGSPHPTIHTHHFLPDAGLERLLGLVHRLRRKLAAIRIGLMTTPGMAHDVAGHAALVASLNPHDTDTLGIVERLASGDPTLLDDIEALDSAPFAAVPRLRRLWQQLPPEERPLRSDSGTRSGKRVPGGEHVLVATLGPEPAQRLGSGTPDAVAALETGGLTPDAVAALETGGQTPDAVVALETGGQTRLLEIASDGKAHEAGPAAARLLETALLQPTGTRTEDTNGARAGGAATSGKDRKHTHRLATIAMRTAAAFVLRTASPPNPDGSTRSALDSPTPLDDSASTPSTRIARLQPRRSPPAYRLLRHLRLAAASTPGGPPPELCDRIDAVTALLDQSLRAGHDAAIEELLAAWQWSHADDPIRLISQVEARIQMRPTPSRTPAPRPLAVILTQRSSLPPAGVSAPRRT